MTARVDVRPMARADLAAVASLLRHAYETSVSHFLTYCQHGVGDFFADGLDHAFLTDGVTRAVAEMNGRVVGFAEWRALAHDETLLTHVCVAEDLRGVGVARMLLESHLQELATDGVVSLDVFLHNKSAVRLYDRLGFEMTSLPAPWIQRPIDQTVDQPSRPVTVRDASSSIAMYERYGFCYVNVERASQTSTFGLIGPHTLRLSSIDELQDDSLLADARTLFPSLTRAFFMAPWGHEAPSGASVLLESVRMRANVGGVMRSLL